MCNNFVSFVQPRFLNFQGSNILKLNSVKVFFYKIMQKSFERKTNVYNEQF